MSKIYQHIHTDAYLGPYMPDIGWYPMPSYLLRRQRIKHLLDVLPPSKILEVGCGVGTLLHDFTHIGYECTGLDMSQDAIHLAKQLDSNHAVKFYHQAPSNWHENFDILFAFEVLEHIEDDLAALKEWLEYVKLGGVCFFSVPNHAHKWTHTDIVAGHVRRYNKEDLIRLCEAAGLTVEVVESYGFPLGNVATILRNKVLEHRHRKQLAKNTNQLPESREARNLQSGMDRNFPLVFRLCKSIIGRISLPLAYIMQHCSRRKNWGEGLIVMARKTSSHESSSRS